MHSTDLGGALFMPMKSQEAVDDDSPLSLSTSIVG